jgi:hypothetical protein
MGAIFGNMAQKACISGRVEIIREGTIQKMLALRNRD